MGHKTFLIYYSQKMSNLHVKWKENEKLIREERNIVDIFD